MDGMTVSRNRSMASGIDLFLAERLCFRYTGNGKNLVVEAHSADSGVIDYTVYDGFSLKQTDGGQIECEGQKLPLDVFAAIAGCDLAVHISDRNITLMDYDGFMDRKERGHDCEMLDIH